MNKMIRSLIAIGLVLVIAMLAASNVAWAGPAAQAEPAGSSQGQMSFDPEKTGPGTVKPPPGDVEICEDGVHSVGGVSVVTVEDLAPGYCVVAFLRNHAFAVGHIPDGAGKVLAQITFLRIFHHGKLVHELPDADGQMQLCYAALPDRTAQLYFLNFYGPQFGQQKDKTSWSPLETTVDGSQACASTQITGAYALIGQ